LLPSTFDNVEAAGAPLALDQRDNRLLGSGLARGAVLGLAADTRFVCFNNRASAPKRAGRSCTVHGFTDTMAEKLSRLVGNAEHTLHLLGAHTL
jgi:hypothetical protein